jgi:hypothetical protein
LTREELLRRNEIEVVDLSPGAVALPGAMKVWQDIQAQRGGGPPSAETPAGPAAEEHRNYLPTPKGRRGALSSESWNVDLKIMSQRWKDDRGRWLMVAENETGCWTAMLVPAFGRQPDQIAFTLHEFREYPTRLSAQQALDQLAIERGWTSSEAIPDDDPEPKPTRRLAAKGRGDAETRGRGENAEGDLIGTNGVVGPSRYLYRTGRRHGEREIFVHQGLGKGGLWGTFWQVGKCFHRVKTPGLPMAIDRETAQVYLHKFAVAKRLKLAPSPIGGNAEVSSLPATSPVTQVAPGAKPKAAKNQEPRTKNQTALVPASPRPRVPASVIELASSLAPLSAAERKTRDKLEAAIERGMREFVAVGNAMAEIRDKKLYRETHGSFEAYCRGRWDRSRAEAYRLIDAAGVVRSLLPAAKKGLPLPANEAQARPLSQVDPDQRLAVWHNVLKKACKDSDGRPAVTAEIVAKEVYAWVTPADELREREEQAKERRAEERRGDAEMRGRGDEPATILPMPSAPSAVSPVSAEPPAGSIDFNWQLGRLKQEIEGVCNRFVDRSHRARLAHFLQDCGVAILRALDEH